MKWLWVGIGEERRVQWTVLVCVVVVELLRGEEDSRAGRRGFLGRGCLVVFIGCARDARDVWVSRVSSCSEGVEQASKRTHTHTRGGVWGWVTGE